MSDTTNPGHLADVREALGAASRATPGPWETPAGRRLHGSISAIIDGRDCQVASMDGQAAMFDLRMEPIVVMSANAAAIVALRNAAPAIAALCDEVERLRADRAKAMIAFSEICESCLTGTQNGIPHDICRAILHDVHRRIREASIGAWDTSYSDQLLAENDEARARIATLEAELTKARDDVAYLRSMAEAQSDDASEVLQSANAHIDALEAELAKAHFRSKTMNEVTLDLASRSVAQNYYFRARAPHHGWASCTVNDTTGELAIQSDWGSASYRWPTGGLGEPTLTHFLGRSGRDVDYLMRKLLMGERSELDRDATIAALKRAILHARRAGNLAREEARAAWGALVEHGHEAYGSDDVFWLTMPHEVRAVLDVGEHAVMVPSTEAIAFKEWILPALVRACGEEIVRRGEPGAPAPALAGQGAAP